MPKRVLRARAKAFDQWTTPEVARPNPIDELGSIIEPVPSPEPEPAAGVAPPIDWSRPFG